MVNPQLYPEIIVKCENGSSADKQVSVLKARLLHHLVNFSEVFGKNPGNPEVDALVNINSALINELLSLPAESATTSENANRQVDWKEILQQQLINANVNVNDAKVKEFADKQAGQISERMGELAEEFVHGALLLSASYDKVTFDVEPQKNLISLAGQEQIFLKKIYLRSLTFHVRLHWGSYSNRLVIFCDGIPANMSCKTRIEVTAKNRTGLIRNYCKVFTPQISVLGTPFLFLPEEYKNPDYSVQDPLSIEVSIHAEELVKINMINMNPPLARSAKRNVVETKKSSTKKRPT